MKADNLSNLSFSTRNIIFIFSPADFFPSVRLFLQHRHRLSISIYLSLSIYLSISVSFSVSLCICISPLSPSFLFEYPDTRSTPDDQHWHLFQPKSLLSTFPPCSLSYLIKSVFTVFSLFLYYILRQFIILYLIRCSRSCVSCCIH